MVELGLRKKDAGIAKSDEVDLTKTRKFYELHEDDLKKPKEKAHPLIESYPDVVSAPVALEKAPVVPTPMQQGDVFVATNSYPQASVQEAKFSRFLRIANGFKQFVTFAWLRNGRGAHSALSY